MTEKILHEFSTRITRAKTLLDTTKHQCALLKKEALKLEKEYEDIQQSRKNAELMEESLKNHYLQTKNNNEQESQKNQKEYEELNQLRELKKKLKRECEICKADYNKNSLILEDLVKERTNLEKFAKQLQDKLEQVNLEKQSMQQENEMNQQQIGQYNAKIQELKEEMKNMKALISSSLGNELKGSTYN